MTDAPPHILIVEARFYEGLADALHSGAAAALDAAGATHERISVPGALEIPVAIGLAIGAVEAGRARFDGYVALGCVIRGETSHYDVVVDQSARGIADLALKHGAAIGNGILTVDNDAQAWARAHPERGNKGGMAAEAALAVVALRKRFGGAR